MNKQEVSTMNKKIKTAVIGSIALSFSASEADLIDFSKGKVSESRSILLAKDHGEMTCGKEMKKKMEECKKLMEEAKCGKKMKECKMIMEKSKEKSKEMACGKCGSMM